MPNRLQQTETSSLGSVLVLMLAILGQSAQGGQPAQNGHQIRVPQVASQQNTANSQAPVNRLRPIPRASLVNQAAHGEVIHEKPERLFRRSSERQTGPIQQASYGCGCGHCTGEPTCENQYEGVIYESGCGAEGCSVAGCDGGCEPSCGGEGYFDLNEASCGLETYGAGGCDACGSPSCGGGCGVSCDADSYNFCLPIFRIEWCRFEFFAGVNSFTGPANFANQAATPAGSRNGSGSFGFYEGFNEGNSLKRLFGVDLSSQIGVRGTQTSLSGTEFTNETRKQLFVTGGLFRRADLGLQYGVVVDYLHDEWWFENDLVQLRGELSWIDGCDREFGYQFMTGLDDSTSEASVINSAGVNFASTVSFEPTDQHRVFFRMTTGCGSQYFAFAGATSNSDGLLGAGMSTAPRKGIAIQAGTAFLIPGEGRTAGRNENESWNLSLGLIYRPGGRLACGRYCRPLFDVADNGTFMVDRQ